MDTLGQPADQPRLHPSRSRRTHIKAEPRLTSQPVHGFRLRPRARMSTDLRKRWSASFGRRRSRHPTGVGGWPSNATRCRRTATALMAQRYPCRSVWLPTPGAVVPSWEEPSLPRNFGGSRDGDDQRQAQRVLMRRSKRAPGHHLLLPRDSEWESDQVCSGPVGGSPT